MRRDRPGFARHRMPFGAQDGIPQELNQSADPVALEAGSLPGLARQVGRPDPDEAYLGRVFTDRELFTRRLFARVMALIDGWRITEPMASGRL